MSVGTSKIEDKINAFTRRYYLNLLVRGVILSLTFLLAYFLLASLIEYNLWLGKAGRLFIFSAFFLVAIYAVFAFLREPLQWIIYKKGLGKEESARLIGTYFPNVSDKLVNLLQLSSQSSNALAEAGIVQKAVSMQDIPFEQAIDLKANRKYLKYLFIPFGVIVVLLIFNSGIFTESTKRIVQFNQEFSPEAPFRFTIQNENLNAFFNEDFTLSVKLEGEALPKAVYMVAGDLRWKMQPANSGAFQYTFENIQQPVDFVLEASGFFSTNYTLSIINRPEINALNVVLDYPAYLGLKSQQLNNAGNLQVPEGTKVTWSISTAFAQRASLFFAENSPNNMQLVDNNLFTFSKSFQNPEDYWIVLENEKSKNKDRLAYRVDVVKDQYPQIAVEILQDSVLYKNILLGGSITDDYGLTNLQLNYSVITEGKETPQQKRVIPIAPSNKQQNFFFQWAVDSLHLKPGDKLLYHLQVWDNDGVNGRKSVRSADYTFALPSEEDLKTEIAQNQKSAERKIDEGIQRARELQKSIDHAREKLRGKQSLDWQDKKMLEDLLNQKTKLDEAIQNLQKENQLLEQKKDAFAEENQRIREKSEQIQKLMDELLDEETKKMFEELQKLLQENTDINQVQKMLDKLDRKEINLEKELERTLSLFKELQYDFKLDQAVQELKNQTEKQEQLLEKTENQDGKKNKEDGNQAQHELAEEQRNLKEKFDKLEEQLKELDELGQELNKEESSDAESQQEISKSQEESEQALEKGENKKSGQQQKQAISKMQQMAKKLEGMQSAMQMEMDQQNLESLRQIIHGLIKLSYDQEGLIKEFGPIQQTDPRYVTISQNQLKLKDDAKVLEDSLLELSKKDAFMGSVVTKEIGELNDHIEKAVGNLKERRKGNASTEMQLSMTSINNLALMLNDHFEMMMNMMANAMPGKGKKKSGQPNSLGKMQEMLNQQMQELKNGGGKQGRELSEEFARMAAEQERIRRALQEMQEKLKQQGGKSLGEDIPMKMEQTEMDLVNKQITEQTIQRQKEILSRLLESEKSMREQDLDDERKGETAKDYNNQIPRVFDEYLKLKEKEVELLKTVPPKLYPYYKQEVGEYFKRIKTQD
ncbi:MAG TPA: hypothetical protein PKH83_06885 [Cyclobacteriaceae bacterium]|nr:hypothetical protein [Cyclobacteriaceae bacterium]